MPCVCFRQQRTSRRLRLCRRSATTSREQMQQIEADEAGICRVNSVKLGDPKSTMLVIACEGQFSKPLNRSRAHGLASPLGAPILAIDAQGPSTGS
jgi:hypothetical protein